MRRVIFSILWMGLLLGPAGAQAAIYGWQDLQGVSHYVSDPEDVPPEYRTRAITVVKDLPLPPLLPEPPENQTARAEETASPTPLRVSDPSAESSYEWGYRAGLDAAAVAPQNPPALSIVQNVQVVESPQPAYVYPNGLYPYGLFGPVFGRGRFHPRRPVTPMLGTPFLQGPAGPPPLGAPGPPPVSFMRR